MSAIVSRDHVDDRADVLAAAGLNGLRLALVALAAGPEPDHAEIELRFWNALHVADILAEIVADPARAGQIFRVRGGQRIVAGNLAGQVRVTAVAAGADATRLALTLAPVGDYSTYTLELVWDAGRIDPFFAAIGFKFRPGCFTNDCAPQLPGRPAQPGPAIDYLAKDYDSLRHVLMTAMAARVPGWKSTSEADFDQVLIDLFAAAGDELSDFQDRVMAEAYLATTRKRVSLARHARLMDYHLHEGNQASTWLALEIAAGQARGCVRDECPLAAEGGDEALVLRQIQLVRVGAVEAAAGRHLVTDQFEAGAAADVQRQALARREDGRQLELEQARQRRDAGRGHVERCAGQDDAGAGQRRGHGPGDRDRRHRRRAGGLCVYLGLDSRRPAQELKEFPPWPDQSRTPTSLPPPARPSAVRAAAISATPGRMTCWSPPCAAP